MREWVQSIVLSVMLVPPEPHPPEGSASSVRIFRAGRNYYRFRLLMWALASFWTTFVVTTLYFIADLAAHGRRTPPWVAPVWHGVGILGLFGLALMLAWTYFEQKLNYDLRWYIVTDRSLRVRQGIWSTQELTTTFANIQEIRVSAGPLQKLMGLADLEIHSAGGGSSGPHGTTSGHVARFSGLDNADEIRDFVVECLRKYRDSGLGEADRHATETADAVAAAQIVLAETRALRAALTKP